uniref:C-type lectin domain-containing protein n=1 Tax=Amphiprion ocellaris TaxID=80972 RepID=A0AAQ5YV70_AMPOC
MRKLKVTRSISHLALYISTSCLHNDLREGGEKVDKKMFTDLATLENQYDNKRLLNFNNKLDFSNWRSNEPNNVNSNQHCVAMTKEGLWRDAICSTKRPAVCFYVFTFILKNPLN